MGAPAQAPSDPFGSLRSPWAGEKRRPMQRAALRSRKSRLIGMLPRRYPAHEQVSHHSLLLDESNAKTDRLSDDRLDSKKNSGSVTPAPRNA